MQVGFFAKKMGMTQIFNEDGNIFPVTVLQTGFYQVSQIKTIHTDGYNAIQLAYDEKKVESLNRAQRGHLTKLDCCAGNGRQFASLGEFHVKDPESFQLSQVIPMETLVVGQKVRVTGTSIGKGFAGNQKRHNFKRGPMTHGSKNHRLPGSIGAGTTPGRVYPGKKMAGRLGGKKLTLKNTEILYVNAKKRILVLKGSLPGKKNTLVKIQPQHQ